MVRQCSKASNFEWVEDTSSFNEDFMKNYNKETNEGCFLQVNVQYLYKLHELHNNYHFYLKELKLKTSKSLLLICLIKLNMVFT